MSRPVTRRQQDILDWINEHTAQRGYAPSIRDIGKHFGIRSPNGVMCHMRSMEKKGVLVWDAMTARSIRVVGEAAEPSDEVTTLRSLLDECDEYLESDDRECVADLRRRIAAATGGSL